MRREVTLSIGSLSSAVPPVAGTEALTVDLGPDHPSSHGLLRLRLTLDDGEILSAEPIIGALHRGAEKLFEVRDYRQAMALANRHDWHGSFTGELGIALAVERMLGMEVPQRATWARTLLAELTRTASHLAFLAATPGLTGARGPAFAGRESIVAVMEETTGGRMHAMAVQVGGLKQDLPRGWLARVSDVVTRLRTRLDLISVSLDDAAFVARTRGVGVLRTEQAEAFGVSGPVARASGLDLDLRRDDPYLAYDALLADGRLRVVTAAAGDVLDRVRLLQEECRASLDLVEACVQMLSSTAPGPINVRLPKVLRAPEGHTYVWTENPLGITGYLLVSRGEPTPWRLKLRTPSFSNVAVLGELLEGSALEDVVLVLASMFYVVGDIDR